MRKAIFRTFGFLIVLVVASGCRNEHQPSHANSTDSAVVTSEGSGGESEAVALAQADTDIARSSPDSADNRPIEVAHDGYVSSAKCLECHPDEHQSWNASFHRTMTQVVTADSVAGNFDGREREFYGWKFRPEKVGEKFFMDVKGTRSDKTFRHELVMSTGSHHMQKYWYPTGDGRKMGLAPLVYLVESDQWVPEHTAFLHPTENALPVREGAWNTGCNQCHATGAEPRISDDQTMDTRVGEFGIACEACHGPGESHVEDKTSASIVNPRTLSAERSSQVCGQCHGAWVMSKETHAAWRSGGHDYKPGDDLHELRKYVVGRENIHLHKAIKAEDSFWSDGENRVAGREYNGLLASPCFTKGDGERKMTCISCHDLHPATDDADALASWANDQLSTSLAGNEACYQCHDDMRSQLVDHTHHAAESGGSLCYNCHMPHTSYGLLKAVRSHTITSPSVAASIETGRPNACNQCHLDKSLEWAASRLNEQYGQEIPKLNNEQQKVAASILWSLKGDAAQRALMAWSMGWDEAQEASGTDWMALYLTELMFDDYDAVRYIAGRSLRSIEGFEDVSHDHLRILDRRDEVMGQVWGIWQSQVKTMPTDSVLLFNKDGGLRFDLFQYLRQNRDNREMVITE